MSGSGSSGGGKKPDHASMSIDPLIGRVLLDRYEVLERIGSGGMGAVYVAKQRAVERQVGLKVLRTDLMSNKHVRERFRREAEIIAKLRHPNTIQLFDYGETEDGLAVMVMELLVGEPLDQYLRIHGSLSLEETLVVGEEIAGSLAEAHLYGMVHRDLKPANIFLVEVAGKKHAKVLDFGIARMLDEESTRITSTGQIFGTPRYMSPEQAMSTADVDARSDLYSLGLILYECLVGQPPFVASTSIQYLSAHSTSPPPMLREQCPGAPGALEELVDACLAKDLEDRPESADAVAACLASIRGSVVHSGKQDTHIAVPGRGRNKGTGGVTVGTQFGTGTSTVLEGAEPAQRPAPKTSAIVLILAAGVLLGVAGFVAKVAWFTGEVELTSRVDAEVSPFTEVDAGQDKAAVVLVDDVGGTPDIDKGDAGFVDTVAEPDASDAGLVDTGAEPDASDAAVGSAIAAVDAGDAGDTGVADAATKKRINKPRTARKPKKGKGRSSRKPSRKPGVKQPVGTGATTGPRSFIVDDVVEDEAAALLSVAKKCKTSIYRGLARLTTKGCPPGCAIVIEDQCAGVTPAEARAIPPGRRRVTVVCKETVQRDGHLRFQADKTSFFRCR